MAWNDEIFREKMDKLNSSQLSIENTSQWMRFYRADARRVADCWEAYFSKADQPKRLAMVYLANDVVQNSRKNAREFLEAFFRVLPRALHHMLAKSDEKTRASVHKVIRVWDERKVFGTTGSRALHELMHGTEAVASPRSAPQQPQQPQQQLQQPQAPDLSALAPQLAGALQQSGAAARQCSQLQAAVGAALPVALGPAATAQQLAAARAAVHGLSAALQQQASSSHTAAGLLRQMLAEQEHAAVQATALVQTCSQHLAQLDTRAAAASQQAQQAQKQQPGEPAAAPPQQAAQPQANGQQQQQQQQLPVPPLQQGLSTSEEAASLAAALASTENSAEALMAAFMELPPDQQEGLGVELAGLLQQPPGAGSGGDLGGGDDLYDPEDL